MQEIVDEAKSTFRRLLAEDDKVATIALLVSLRAQVDLPIGDKGWALWNICDNYAMLRDAKSQHWYQSEFHEWSKATLFPHRLHWVVSDGTQAMTLIAGGFLEFWGHCYQFANAACPRTPENRTVRFESHRANAAAYSYFREFSRAESALTALEQLLAEDQTWHNRDFATVTFRTLLVDFYNASGQGDKLVHTMGVLEQELEDWLRHAGDATDPTPAETPLLGSWEQLNAERPPSAVFVGIHNAACEFARAQQFPMAERLFRVLQVKGTPASGYGEALFLWSCWKNRHNRDEIVEWLNTSNTVTLADLQRFVPELAAVVTKATPFV